VRSLASVFAVIAALLAQNSVLMAQDVSLSAPKSAPLNSFVTVRWSGPGKSGDLITIGRANGKPVPYASYAYTAKSGGIVKVRLPERAGAYTIVYVSKKDGVLHSVAIAADPVTATLNAPDKVTANSGFEVVWTGPDNKGDTITIGNAKGRPIPYSSKGYTAQNPKKMALKAPEKPGSYTILYLTGRSVVATRPLTVTGFEATIEAPASVAANSAFSIRWTGPDNPKDYITIGKANGTPIPYSSYGYTARHPGKMPLKAPEKPGDYTVVYVSGKTPVVHVPLKVTGLSATIAVPETVPAGAPFSVTWSGPENEGDRLRIHTAKGKWIPYASYAYTAHNPGKAELVAPEKPGTYSVAYVTGDTVVGFVPLKVVEVTASLVAEDEVAAGLPFPIKWTGPGNRRDAIVMLGDDPNFPLARGYIANSEGDTVMLTAPGHSGRFDLRYVTPGGRELARRPIRVVAPPKKPGTLVVLPVTRATTLSALEVILDASGSMLKRQGGKRRIDIAKATLAGLLRDIVPAGTPFALRVFGHKQADSCRTDLEIPLAPLDTKAVLGLVGKIRAKNLAKTPIARSLDLTASDLEKADGERVVILITDGEETCEGDPAAAISNLRRTGSDIRVNIVGYAIEDAKLAETFAEWAKLGGGAYFAAGNGDQLAAALLAAAQPKFSVVDAKGTVLARGLAGGDPITLPAGRYEVRFTVGGKPKAVWAQVRPEVETEMSLR